MTTLRFSRIALYCFVACSALPIGAAAKSSGIARDPDKLIPGKVNGVDAVGPTKIASAQVTSAIATNCKRNAVPNTVRRKGGPLCMSNAGYCNEDRGVCVCGPWVYTNYGDEQRAEKFQPEYPLENRALTSYDYTRSFTSTFRKRMMRSVT